MGKALYYIQVLVQSEDINYDCMSTTMRLEYDGNMIYWCEVTGRKNTPRGLCQPEQKVQASHQCNRICYLVIKLSTDACRLDKLWQVIRT